MKTCLPYRSTIKKGYCIVCITTQGENCLIQCQKHLNETDHNMSLSRSINFMAIDGQVYFYKCLFTNTVRPSWCITGPVGPLGHTNQDWLCARLLPMVVSIYPVVYVHSCCLLGTRHYCLWPNGREDPPLVCPPTPSHPPTSL